MTENARQKVHLGARAVLVVMTLAPLALTGCREQETGQRQRSGPLVSVERVEQGAIVRSLNLTAEVVPALAIMVSATVEGPISGQPWREGDHVKAGQKLVEVDRAMYRAEVETAAASLSVARARLEDLRAGTRPEEVDKARQSVREAEQNAAFEEDELGRVTALVATGALPGEDLDRARVRHVAAQARLDSARRQLEMLEAGPTRTSVAVLEASVQEAAARLGLARTRLEECVIKAPFDATVAQVFARPGDMAAARSPLLELVDMDSLVLRFAVPEAQAAAVRRGMTLTARLDAFPGRDVDAEVVRVYPRLDPRTRTRTVEAAPADPVGFAPSMFARIDLELDRAEDALLVPSDAVVVTPAGERIVYVIEDGKAEQRPVETGLEDGVKTQVVSGLAPGDRIAVAGNEQLRPGMPVRVVGARGPGQGANGQPPGRGGGSGRGDPP